MGGFAEHGGIFGCLRSDQVAKISDSSSVVERKAGEKLFQRGDQADFFFVVLKGQVNLLFKADGKEVVVDKVLENGICGLSAAMNMQDYYLTGECAEDTKVVRIKYEALNRLMEDDLRTGFTIQKTISEAYFKRYVNSMKKMKSLFKATHSKMGLMTEEKWSHANFM